MTKPVDVIYLDEADNICVAAHDLPAGMSLQVGSHEFVLCDDIRMGHKIAVCDISSNAAVLKYGQSIGLTTDTVRAGQWVHVHNVKHVSSSKGYEKATVPGFKPDPITDRTFMGYKRPNGKVGTRNYIGILSSVNCSATVARTISSHFGDDELLDYPNIDGVVAFTHGEGCGMEFGGTKHEMLNRVMGGMARHPNMGGYLIVGLGCEQSTIGYLVESQKLVQIQGSDEQISGPPVLSMQDHGGTARTVELGIEQVRKLLPRANAVQREEVPASEIVLGLECGGSDGNSGITANPAVGAASDLLVACGGTAVLSEMPEVYGAEHLLTARSRSVAVADKLIERIQWWEWYTGLFGESMNDNPSMGNKEGGLTTIAEKSLGAIAKGGSTVLEAVYEYAQQIDQRGFVLMDTPGFDPPSVTGMVAGGANVVVFTTGRGSCFGCKPTPSIKVATNTPMYQRMIDDMDINAGTILTGVSIDEIGREIFEEVLAVASGKQTRSEVHGIGEDEFVPWTIGAQL
ncbi:MAG: altronate dehydratase family protein [Planctomycetota bacterium]|nr:altronate dehydratase family protein [Planctomycetota bacterium]